MVFGTSTVTTSDLIRRTLAHCQGNSRQAVNRLASDFSTSQSSMAMDFPITGVQVGQTIEVGWNLYTVADVNTSTKTVSVIAETAAESHSEGDRVTMRPRFPARRIIETINEDLHDLSMNGLYRIETEEGVGDDGELPDPPAGAVAVLAVWSKEKGLDPRPLPPAHYRLADTPDGIKLRGPEPGIEYVTFGCLFNTLSITTDQVVTDTTGLEATALDLPPLGAALTLMADREASRNQINAQGDTRRAEEVPPGANAAMMASVARLRSNRIMAEAGRLIERYGYIREVSSLYG